MYIRESTHPPSFSLLPRVPSLQSSFSGSLPSSVCLPSLFAAGFFSSRFQDPGPVPACHKSLVRFVRTQRFPAAGWSSPVPLVTVFTKKGTFKSKHQQNQGTRDTSLEVLPSPCQFPSELFHYPYPKRQLTLSAFVSLLASGATIVKISIGGQKQTSRAQVDCFPASHFFPHQQKACGVFLRVNTIRGIPAR